MYDLKGLLKNITCSLVLSATLLQANSNYIAYQGVAFNNGAVIASSPISLEFTILTSLDVVVYKETVSGVTTTDKGFFSHSIGSGTKTEGTDYANITWADDYKLKVGVDYTNGTSYTDLGAQDFASSVYALKAKTADSATTATKLATPITIAGKSFDGSSNIDLPGVNIAGTQSTLGNAATATALAVDPGPCSNGQYVKDIAANGTLTCATPPNTTYSANNGVSLSGTTFSHADTSTQSSLNYGGATVIQGIYLDTYGHIISLATVGVAAESHTHAYLPLAGGVVSGQVNINNTLGVAGEIQATSIYAGTGALRNISNYNFLSITSGTIGNTSTSPNYYSVYAANRIAASEFNAFSDKRIKTEIQPIENSLETIKKLTPSSYKKIDKVQFGYGLHYGFIAQELEKVIPEAVTKGKGEVPVLKKFDEVSFEEGAEYKVLVKNGEEIKEQSYTKGQAKPDGDPVVISKKVDDFRTVDYNMVFTHAVAAIKEQQKIIEELQSEIKTIKDELKKINTIK